MSFVLRSNFDFVFSSKAPGYIREDILEDFVGGDDNDEIQEEQNFGGTDSAGDEFESSILDTRRSCMFYNLTNNADRQACTPGGEYIIRCRICVCPYMGYINNFCKPMPANRYCEQAFPDFNYMVMSRRADGENRTVLNMTDLEYPIEIKLPHNHTKYRCEKPGNLTDECFICECEPDRILVEEHCYKSDNKACTDATPTFIKNGDHPVAFEKYKSEEEE